MSDQPNDQLSELTRLAKRAWDAVSRADADTLCEILAPDVIWHATGATPWRGDHRGLESVLDYLARVGELTDVFDASLIDVLASEERVQVVFHVRVAQAGRTVEVDYSLLARVHEGRATAVWTSPLDPDALSRFWKK